MTTVDEWLRDQGKRFEEALAMQDRTIALQRQEIELLRDQLRTYTSRHYTCQVCGAHWDTVSQADACHVRHAERGAS